MPTKVRLFSEAMGLHPLGERYRQAKIALRGEDDVPPAQFGLSSLMLLRPRIAVPLWRGKPYIDRQVILTNLFNHRQTDIDLGWSVKRTQVEDFRGRELTYDSHNGTDFSIAVGTTVQTAAPGRVVRVVSEFQRGGLKVFIDHGDGLMTNYAHLARALVREGDIVTRGQPIALSGYSGLDGATTFPWGVPHVHFNVWLNATPIDPFERQGDGSMWRAGALPASTRQTDEGPPDAVFDASLVDEAIAGIKTPRVRARIAAHDDLQKRAAATIIEMNYYPTRFARRFNVYRETHARTGRLDLPFSPNDFDGVVFVDAM